MAIADGQDAGWVDQVNYVASPVLSASTLANGQLPLTIEAAAGQRVEIQASTNLVRWTTIGVLTNANGATPFIDTAATNFNSRFYRTLTP